MATTSFYIISVSTKNHANINVSFSFKRGVAPFRKSLSITIPVKAWDKNKQKLRDIASVYKYRSAVNHKLDAIIKFFENYNNSHADIDKHHLKIAFNEFLNPTSKQDTLYFSDYINNYITNVAPVRVNPKTKKIVGKRAIQGYTTTYRYIKKYEAHKGVRLKITDVNLYFHHSFLKFLQNEHNLAKNTIGGYIKNIKIFVKQAQKNKLPINIEALSSDFYLPSENTKSIYLTEAEIDKLYNYDLSDNLRFQKVRDWAIIGLWTGLRVSDWNRFNKIENDLITIETQKTGKKVVIPLHWQIKELIQKRGLPQMVSDVEFNRIIKKVCCLCGIDNLVEGSRRNKTTNRKETGLFEKYKLVSSHTCRRTFSTLAYKIGVDTLTIMNITGHTTEKSFLKYIKITPNEHALKLKAHWDIYYNKN